MNDKRSQCLAVARFVLAITFASGTLAQAAERPNLLVIMADDLGFSDLGCYGGEIETPTLDALAAGGLRFSQFYNTAKCHSSRVSLLTGQYCIAAGDVSLSHAVTTAEMLRAGGYFTAMTGKWHLKQQPTDFGFDHYFGHLSGACNYFQGDNTFRLNGEPWTVPKNGFYTTVANIDYGLTFLKQASNTGKPWYLYVAFNAPHAPLQALPEDYAKYEGRYDSGWDVIRQARLDKQQQLGLFPEACQASPRPDHIPAWESLSDARRTFESKRMTTLAAMIDRVDREIGRLVSHLKSSGQFDNTLIWFVSDNGACPYDRRSNRLEAKPIDGSVSWSDSTGWAWTRNSPFRFYKQNQFEGGICTPAIVHWPAGLKTVPGNIATQPAHLIDVMPTLAEVTNSSIPSEFEDRELREISGTSLRPIFDGQTIERDDPLHFLFASDRGLREGDWKLVSFRSGPWELYDLSCDRTELDNLADEQPDRLSRMVERWTSMAQHVLHVNERSMRPVDEEPISKRHPEWTNFLLDPSADRKGNARAGENETPAKERDRLSIRARKNTEMKIEANLLKLTFTGDDPGLAFDRLPENLSVGPYTLVFELNSEAVGDGEVYFATDATTPLPKSIRVPFSVTSDGAWHKFEIGLPTDQRLHKLRLDVSEGAGAAQVRGLRLTTERGEVLLRWPDGQPSAREQ